VGIIKHLRGVAADIYVIALPFTILRGVHALPIRAQGAIVHLDFADYWSEFSRQPWRTLANIAVRASCLLAHSISASTHAMTNLLRGYSSVATPVLWVPNALNSQFLEVNVDPDADDLLRKRVVYCGVLSKERGVDSMLEIARAVLDTDPRILFEFIGDGPEVDRMKRRVEQLGISEGVVFRGRVPRSEVVPLMVGAQVGLCPGLFDTPKSRIGDFPQKVPEYMALGLVPIVSRAIAEAPYIIRHKEEGLICNEDEMANAILDLYSDRDQLTKMRKAAIARARRDFSWASLSRELVGLWARAISRE